MISSRDAGSRDAHEVITQDCFVLATPQVEELSHCAVPALWQWLLDFTCRWSICLVEVLSRVLGQQWSGLRSAPLLHCSDVP